MHIHKEEGGEIGGREGDQIKISVKQRKKEKKQWLIRNVFKKMSQMVLLIVNSLTTVSP